MDSRLSGFYELDLADRVETVIENSDLSRESETVLRDRDDQPVVDDLSENVIGSISLPLSVATNFVIDGEERLIPMAIEESSVVAAASHGARMARSTGGFSTSVSGPYMIAQVQILDVADPHAASARLLERSSAVIELANDQGVLVSHGGGCEDLSTRVVETPEGEMLIAHLLVNVQDAMGANAVNTMAEGVAPLVEEITGGTVSLRILSNLADCRVARACCRVDPAEFERDDVDVSGVEVRDRIVDAWAFAAGDPYRAATHNKGILNGIDALAVATLNDWRAIEAGAHAYAARGGYGPLSTYEVDDEGFLACSIELPVQVGTVGGATEIHPTAKAASEILDVDSAEAFAGVFAALGLAENLASLRALVSEGIQTGHMKLHARNVAIEAGAPDDAVEEIAEQMVEEGEVRQSRAAELVAESEKRD
jgi:hydroxymethylglutaryl-CoA reductase